MTETPKQERCLTDEIRRFWKFVDRSPGHGPHGDCWLWIGGKKSKSDPQHFYGRFYIRKGHVMYAHRWIYEYVFGPVGALLICHSCDNPACVNPLHLFTGTQKENMQDAADKGRANQGNANGHSRLSLIDVLAIRSATGTFREIGERFGIRSGHVSAIKTRRLWKHL